MEIGQIIASSIFALSLKRGMREMRGAKAGTKAVLLGCVGQGARASGRPTFELTAKRSGLAILSHSHPLSSLEKGLNVSTDTTQIMDARGSHRIPLSKPLTAGPKHPACLSTDESHIHLLAAVRDLPTIHTSIDAPFLAPH
jgi:hypothetical protein